MIALTPAVAPGAGKGDVEEIPSGRVDLTPVSGAEGLFQVDKIHPKGEEPFPTRFEGELRTCGIYLMDAHLFEYIERAAETHEGGELTDAPVFDLILAERGLLGRKLRAKLFDIGSPAGYDACLDAVQGQ